MKTAEGIGTWHNQYNNQLPIEKCVKRAQRARLDFVIVKYGLRQAEIAYAEAGVPWATERFIYAGQPAREANMLADAVDNGACFAVINVEEGGGWGPDTDGGEIKEIATTFCDRHPTVCLYACLDTRGGRLNHPYQQAASEWCDGIMPMIYPGAFYPHQPFGYIEAAFRDALMGGKDFGDQAVYPVLQSYGWNDPPGGPARAMSPIGIRIQAEQASSYPGYSFYTIHHATDEEWGAVCALKPEPEPDIPAKEKCELAIYRGSKPLIHLATDGEWAALHAKLHEMKVDA